MAAGKEISVDAATAAVLSELETQGFSLYKDNGAKMHMSCDFFGFVCVCVTQL